MTAVKGSYRYQSGRSVRLGLLALCTVCCYGCMSAGFVTLDSNRFLLNRSDIDRVDQGYRLWLWRYVGWPLAPLGRSPVGLQMVLPEALALDTPLRVGDECEIWVRRSWSVAGAATAGHWRPINSGVLVISAWAPQTGEAEGYFEFRSSGQEISGRFSIDATTHSDNVLR